MCKRINLIDIAIVSAAGALLHFVYDWSGGNSLVGIFSAVSESIWEHLKLLFWPTTLLSIIEYFLCYKNRNDFLLSRMVATIIGMAFIVSAYYTFTGIIGKNIDAFNIALFFISVILTFFVSNLFMKNNTFGAKNSNIIAMLLFAFFAALFCIFTKNTPSLGIFSEP